MGLMPLSDRADRLLDMRGNVGFRQDWTPFFLPPIFGSLASGGFGSRGIQFGRMCQTPRAVSDPRSEPDCMTWSVSEHDQPHIRSPLEAAAPTSRLRRAGAQEDETILSIGFSGHALQSVRPPGSARTDPVLGDSSIWLASILSRLHHGAVDDDAGGDYFHKATSSLRARATMVDFLK